MSHPVSPERPMTPQTPQTAADSQSALRELERSLTSIVAAAAVLDHHRADDTDGFAAALQQISAAAAPAAQATAADLLTTLMCPSCPPMSGHTRPSLASAAAWWGSLSRAAASFPTVAGRVVLRLLSGAAQFPALRSEAQTAAVAVGRLAASLMALSQPGGNGLSVELTAVGARYAACAALCLVHLSHDDATAAELVAMATEAASVDDSAAATIIANLVMDLQTDTAHTDAPECTSAGCALLAQACVAHPVLWNADVAQCLGRIVERVAGAFDDAGAAAFLLACLADQHDRTIMARRVVPPVTSPATPTPATPSAATDGSPGPAAAPTPAGVRSRIKALPGAPVQAAGRLKRGLSRVAGAFTSAVGASAHSDSHSPDMLGSSLGARDPSPESPLSSLAVGGPSFVWSMQTHTAAATMALELASARAGSWRLALLRVLPVTLMQSRGSFDAAGLKDDIHDVVATATMGCARLPPAAQLAAVHLVHHTYTELRLPAGDELTGVIALAMAPTVDPPTLAAVAACVADVMLRGELLDHALEDAVVSVLGATAQGIARAAVDLIGNVLDEPPTDGAASSRAEAQLHSFSGALVDCVTTLARCGGHPGTGEGNGCSDFSTSRNMSTFSLTSQHGDDASASAAAQALTVARNEVIDAVCSVAGACRLAGDVAHDALVAAARHPHFQPRLAQIVLAHVDATAAQATGERSSATLPPTPMATSSAHASFFSTSAGALRPLGGGGGVSNGSGLLGAPSVDDVNAAASSEMGLVSHVPWTATAALLAAVAQAVSDVSPLSDSACESPTRDQSRNHAGFVTEWASIFTDCFCSARTTSYGAGPERPPSADGTSSYDIRLLAACHDTTLPLLQLLAHAQRQSADEAIPRVHAALEGVAAFLVEEAGLLDETAGFIDCLAHDILAVAAEHAAALRFGIAIFYCEQLVVFARLRDRIAASCATASAVANADSSDSDDATRQGDESEAAARHRAVAKTVNGTYTMFRQRSIRLLSAIANAASAVLTHHAIATRDAGLLAAMEPSAAGMEFLDLEVQRALRRHDAGDVTDMESPASSSTGTFELHGWRRLLLRAMFRPHVAFYGGGGISILRAASLSAGPSAHDASLKGGDALSVGAWLQVSATPATMRGMSAASAADLTSHTHGGGGDDEDEHGGPEQAPHDGASSNAAAAEARQGGSGGGDAIGLMSILGGTTPIPLIVSLNDDALCIEQPGARPRLVLNTQALTSTRAGAWFHLAVIVVKQTVSVFVNGAPVGHPHKLDDPITPVQKILVGPGALPDTRRVTPPPPSASAAPEGSPTRRAIGARGTASGRKIRVRPVSFKNGDEDRNQRRNSRRHHKHADGTSVSVTLVGSISVADHAWAPESLPTGFFSWPSPGSRRATEDELWALMHAAIPTAVSASSPLTTSAVFQPHDSVRRADGSQHGLNEAASQQLPTTARTLSTMAEIINSHPTATSSPSWRAFTTGRHSPLPGPRVFLRSFYISRGGIEHLREAVRSANGNVSRLVSALRVIRVVTRSPAVPVSAAIVLMRLAAAALQSAPVPTKELVQTAVSTAVFDRSSEGVGDGHASEYAHVVTSPGPLRDSHHASPARRVASRRGTTVTMPAVVSTDALAVGSAMNNTMMTGTDGGAAVPLSNVNPGGAGWCAVCDGHAAVTLVADLSVLRRAPTAVVVAALGKVQRCLVPVLADPRSLYLADASWGLLDGARFAEHLLCSIVREAASLPTTVLRAAANLLSECVAAAVRCDSPSLHSLLQLLTSATASVVPCGRVVYVDTFSPHRQSRAGGADADATMARSGDGDDGNGVDDREALSRLNARNPTFRAPALALGSHPSAHPATYGHTRKHHHHHRGGVTGPAEVVVRPSDAALDEVLVVLLRCIERAHTSAMAAAAVAGSTAPVAKGASRAKAILGEVLPVSWYRHIAHPSVPPQALASVLRLMARYAPAATLPRPTAGAIAQPIVTRPWFYWNACAQLMLEACGHAVDGRAAQQRGAVALASDGTAGPVPADIDVNHALLSVFLSTLHHLLSAAVQLPAAPLPVAATAPAAEQRGGDSSAAQCPTHIGLRWRRLRSVVRTCVALQRAAHGGASDLPRTTSGSVAREAVSWLLGWARNPNLAAAILANDRGSDLMVAVTQTLCAADTAAMGSPDSPAGSSAPGSFAQPPADDADTSALEDVSFAGGGSFSPHHNVGGGGATGTPVNADNLGICVTTPAGGTVGVSTAPDGAPAAGASVTGDAASPAAGLVRRSGTLGGRSTGGNLRGARGLGSVATIVSLDDLFAADDDFEPDDLDGANENDSGASDDDAAEAPSAEPHTPAKPMLVAASSFAAMPSAVKSWQSSRKSRATNVSERKAILRLGGAVHPPHRHGRHSAAAAAGTPSRTHHGGGDGGALSPLSFHHRHSRTMSGTGGATNSEFASPVARGPLAAAKAAAAVTASPDVRPLEPPRSLRRSGASDADSNASASEAASDNGDLVNDSIVQRDGSIGEPLLSDAGATASVMLEVQRTTMLLDDSENEAAQAQVNDSVADMFEAFVSASLTTAADVHGKSAARTDERVGPQLRQRYGPCGTLFFELLFRTPRGLEAALMGRFCGAVETSVNRVLDGLSPASSLHSVVRRNLAGFLLHLVDRVSFGADAGPLLDYVDRLKPSLAPPRPAGTGAAPDTFPESVRRDLDATLATLNLRQATALLSAMRNPSATLESITAATQRFAQHFTTAKEIASMAPTTAELHDALLVAFAQAVVMLRNSEALRAASPRHQDPTSLTATADAVTLLRDAAMLVLRTALRASPGGHLAARMSKLSITDMRRIDFSANFAAAAADDAEPFMSWFFDPSRATDIEWVVRKVTKTAVKAQTRHDEAAVHMYARGLAAFVAHLDRTALDEEEPATPTAAHGGDGSRHRWPGVVSSLPQHLSHFAGPLPPYVRIVPTAFADSMASFGAVSTAAHHELRWPRPKLVARARVELRPSERHVLAADHHDNVVRLIATSGTGAPSVGPEEDFREATDESVDAWSRQCDGPDGPDGRRQWLRFTAEDAEEQEQRLRDGDALLPLANFAPPCCFPVAPWRAVSGDSTILSPRCTSRVSESALALLTVLVPRGQCIEAVANAILVSNADVVTVVVVVTNLAVHMLSRAHVTPRGDLVVGTKAGDAEVLQPRRAKSTDRGGAAGRELSVDPAGDDDHNDAASAASPAVAAVHAVGGLIGSVAHRAKGALRTAKRRLLGDGDADGEHYRGAVSRRYGATAVLRQPGVWSVPMSAVRSIRAASFEHADVAIEVDARGDTGSIIAPLDTVTGSMSPATRDALMASIATVAGHAEVIKRDDLKAALAKATAQWQQGQLSNLLYLKAVNSASGRTRRDVAQYPIMPNLIADYDAPRFDPEAPGALRDLAWPVGAQTEHRREELTARFAAQCEALSEMPMDFADASLEFSSPAVSGGAGGTVALPPAAPFHGAFHHGTHYSSCGATAYFLLRLQPWTNIAFGLQSGHFDNPDRLFASLPEHWRSSVAGSGDCKEWVPELYESTAAFINTARVYFGRRRERGSERVDDVVLPRWAHGEPARFMWTLRAAIESDAASASLHEWIDLIFGARQEGAKAVERLNVFQPLSYAAHMQATLSSAYSDDVERAAAVSFAANFGQTPRPVFKALHPPRRAPAVVSATDAGDLTASILAPPATDGAAPATATAADAHPNHGHCRTAVVVATRAHFLVNAVVGLVHPAVADSVSFAPAVSRVVRTGSATVTVEPPGCSIVGDKAEHYYAVRSCDRRIVKCATATGAHVAVLPFRPPCGEPVSSMLVTPKEELGLIGVASGAIYVLTRDLKSGLLTHQGTLLGHTSAVSRLLFCPPSSRVVSLDAHGAAIVWRVRRLRCDALHELVVPRNVVPAAGDGATSPTGAGVGSGDGATSRGRASYHGGATSQASMARNSASAVPSGKRERVRRDTDERGPVVPIVALALNTLDVNTVAVTPFALAIFDSDGALVGIAASPLEAAITAVACFEFPDTPYATNLVCTGHSDGRTHLWSYRVDTKTAAAAEDRPTDDDNDDDLAAAHTIMDVRYIGPLGPPAEDSSPVTFISINSVTAAVTVGRANGTLRVRSPATEDWAAMPKESPLLPGQIATVLVGSAS